MEECKSPSVNVSRSTFPCGSSEPGIYTSPLHTVSHTLRDSPSLKLHLVICLSLCIAAGSVHLSLSIVCLFYQASHGPIICVCTVYDRGKKGACALGVDRNGGWYEGVGALKRICFRLVSQHAV